MQEYRRNKDMQILTERAIAARRQAMDNGIALWAWGERRSPLARRGNDRMADWFARFDQARGVK